MVQVSSGIGNVTTNAGLVEMAMAYSRSHVLCAAARLGVADALGDEVRSVGFLAEKCQADANALYRLLRALASIGVTEETMPEHFRLTPFGRPLRRDVPQSVWAAVVFRRVSTTLRQVLTEFSEFFECWVFHKEISRQDRLATTIANAVDPQHPRFCPSSSMFRFSKGDRCWFIRLLPQAAVPEWQPAC
jgi:hypothetical protein